MDWIQSFNPLAFLLAQMGFLRAAIGFNICNIQSRLAALGAD